MPIDFDAIVRRFRPLFVRELRVLSESVKRIAAVLGKTVAANESLDRATRDFPTIDFREDALTMSIGRFHQGLLPPFEARPSPGAAARFRAGLGRIPEAVEEELAVPRLLLTVREALEAMVDSLERWDRATPSMFDVTIPRRGSDLFGQAFLFVEALASSTEQIRTVVNSRLAAALVRSLTAETSGGGAGGGGMSLDRVIRAMVAALLVIPLTGLWLDALIRSAVLAVKVRALAGFQDIERRLYGMRNTLVTGWYGELVSIGHAAWAWAEASGHILRDNLRYVSALGVLYATAWVEALSRYVRGWEGVLRGYVTTVEKLRHAIDAIFGFDLGAWITDKLGLPTISLTLGDLVNATVGVGSAIAYASLKSALFVASLTIIPSVRRRARAASALLDHLFGGPVPFEVVPLPPRAPAFPDVYANFFGSRATVDIQSELRQLSRLPEDVFGFFQAGQWALADMAGTFSREAGRAARFTSMDRWRAAATRAGEFSNLLFGDQREALRRRIASHADLFVQAFDRAVAGGAFHIVGAAIPLYVEAMRDYWARERETGSTPAVAPTSEAAPANPPTSPHILARHARLERVRVPSLTIRASGRALDDDLIARVAERVRGAVGQAYLQGLERAAVSP